MERHHRLSITRPGNVTEGPGRRSSESGRGLQHFQPNAGMLTGKEPVYQHDLLILPESPDVSFLYLKLKRIIVDVAIATELKEKLMALGI